MHIDNTANTENIDNIKHTDITGVFTVSQIECDNKLRKQGSCSHPGRLLVVEAVFQL